MAQDKLTITFDVLPERQLRKNKLRQLHWAQRWKLTIVERERGKIIALQQRGDWIAPEKAIINFLFIRTNNRRTDPDSWLFAAAAWLDGFVDAGILIDDDSEHLVIGRCEVVKGEQEGTIVSIEAIEKE